MNLPNYFLADLPDSKVVTSLVLVEACQTLKRNRERYLQNRSTQSLIRVISTVAKSWLDSDDPFRKYALEFGPARTGFSRPTLEAGLDSFFKEITPETLQALLMQDLGDPQRLDSLCANVHEQKLNRASSVRSPELLAHITGGVLPNPTITSMILGLLARSAQFVKCARGTSFLPRIFAHSIYEAEPKLGACMEIAEWKGGTEPLENALFAEADLVTATGSDETLKNICSRIPFGTRFLGYGQRVSFGYVTQEILSGMNPQKVVRNAARDVTAWDQLGCLSPHVFFVEGAGKISAEQFAEMLAGELERMEQTEPRGKLSVEKSADIAFRRSFYEVRSGSSPDTKLWQSADSTAWTVIFEKDPRFQLSCLNRFIYVKEVADLTQALQGTDAVRGKISTVGIAATEDKTQMLANQLAQWGVTRICPLGQMQTPSLLWRHDGRPSLEDLVTWTDWEM